MPRPGLGLAAALVAATTAAAGGAVSATAGTAGSGASATWTITTLADPPGAATSYAEPGIAIAADGTALVDAATANTGAPPTFWESPDNGSSWSVGQDFDSSGGATGDADVAIGADGYRYVLNLGYSSSPPPAQPSNPTVLVYRSPDGVHWLGPATFPAPHGLDQPDRPWLGIDPHNPANVDVINSEGGGNIVIWRSADHGAPFSGPGAVTGGANSQAALALSSRPLFDPSASGRMDMLYETAAAPGVVAVGTAGSPGYEFPMTQLWLAESVDAGATWTSHVVVDTASAGSPLQGGTLAHLLVASAIDPAGNLYAAFALRAAGAAQTDIELIHSTDHGATWSPPLRVSSPVPSNVMPALAVSPMGVVYLSWYGSAASDFSDPQAQWVEMFSAVTNPLTASPTVATERVPGVPVVHVGGVDSAGAVGSDAGDNWGLRDFQSIAVDSCGRPHPVWAVDAGVHATQTGTPSPPCLAQGPPPTTVAETPLPIAAVAAGVCAGLVAWSRRRRRYDRGDALAPDAPDRARRH